MNFIKNIILKINIDKLFVKYIKDTPKPLGRWGQTNLKDIDNKNKYIIFNILSSNEHSLSNQFNEDIIQRT